MEVNYKPDWQSGKVQMIAASYCSELCRKSIRTKRNGINNSYWTLIAKAYGEFENGGIYGDKARSYCESKVFPIMILAIRKSRWRFYYAMSKGELSARKMTSLKQIVACGIPKMCCSMKMLILKSYFAFQLQYLECLRGQQDSMRCTVRGGKIECV